jgi:hypothetical protein
MNEQILGNTVNNITRQFTKGVTIAQELPAWYCVQNLFLGLLFILHMTSAFQKSYVPLYNTTYKHY